MVRTASLFKLSVLARRLGDKLFPGRLPEHLGSPRKGKHVTKVEIEIEIAFEEHETAEQLTTRLMNGESHIGRKHGQWVVFITCPLSEILHLGQELHYELYALTDDE